MENYENSISAAKRLPRQTIQPSLSLLAQNQQDKFEELSGRRVEDLQTGSISKLPASVRPNKINELTESVEKKLSGRFCKRL